MAIPCTAVGGVEVEQVVVLHEGALSLDPLVVLLDFALTR